MRIQLNMSEKRVKEVELLMEQTGISTKKDFFNTALALLEWAIKERQHNRIIASIDEDEGDYKELLIPALNAVTKQIWPEPVVTTKDNDNEKDNETDDNTNGASREKITPVRVL